MKRKFNFAHQLYYGYERFKERSFSDFRIKHSDIIPLIDQLKENKIFGVHKAGTSVEGREIYRISVGSGERKVFLWSQMHGDEPTATLAMFDFFNFFKSVDEFGEIKELIFNELTVYFMPMVNPDGAEKFTRRNAFNIDINRDAVAQQSPESQILFNTFDELKPEFGFNLHDQDQYYSAGDTFKSSTVSLLAPPFNKNKDVNIVRKKAMQVISDLYLLLNEFIPGHIAKYNDEFEPRAFGDNFQKWGMSTILIESGYWKNDTEKEFARKLNFISILHALKCIAQKTYTKCDIEIYNSIPENKETCFDLLIKNGTVIINGEKLKVDIGINRKLKSIAGNNFYYVSSIEDIGDLSTFNGHEEFDLTGYEITSGKTYHKTFSRISQLEKIDSDELMKKGYTSVRLKSKKKLKFSPFSFNISYAVNKKSNNEIKIETPANLLIKKNNKIKYVVVNGFFKNLITGKGKIINGTVIN